jgi:hypothetical protein
MYLEYTKKIKLTLNGGSCHESGYLLIRIKNSQLQLDENLATGFELN